jgi:maltose alpha-D-glucosyltransferase/alpha-amylase
VLCVTNLSRFAQPVDLDLSNLEGMIPVEMLGYVEFPPIGRQPYRLTLGPYGFFWLELHGDPEPVEVRPDELKESALTVTNEWESVLDGSGAHRMETILLPDYLPKQRWFGGKSRRVGVTRILDWAALQPSKAALALVEVQYEGGGTEMYLVLLGMMFGQTADELRRAVPNAVISPIASREGSGILHDGVYDDGACAALLLLIENSGEVAMRRGTIRGQPSAAFQELRGTAPLPVRRSSAEQSNTSVLYDDRLILKLFRRQQPGPNPDVEVGRYLTEKAHFEGIPPFAGSIEYAPAEGEPSTLAMLQGLVPNEGDAWKWTLEEVERYYEESAPLPFPDAAETELQDLGELSKNPPSQLARDHIGIYLDSAATLGRRTAELHLALAQPTDDPAFAPEPLTSSDLQNLRADLRKQAASVFEVLKESMSQLPDDAIDVAALVLSRRRPILDHFRLLATESLNAERTRIHGDYHLGQILRAKTNFVILDFEGEPARPIAERRSKQSPLKDVAGMLRSFSYAAYATLINYTARRPEDLTRLEPWARLWERSIAAEFLRAYRERAQGAKFLPSDDNDFRKLLDAHLLDKALYELLYELNNRPAWVRIPLLGILSLPL